MFKHFLSLQWKSFFRSSNLGKSLALKVIMIFFAIYMLVSFIGLGISSFFILKDAFPEVDPLLKVSQYLGYWIAFELVFRYLMQKLPVLDIKPFLLLPIKKSKITHYILARSSFSFYNLLSLVIFIPFGIVLMTQGYSVLKVLLWLVSIMGIIMTINYVNFLINKSDKIFFALLTTFISIYALDYFNVFSITNYLGKLFYALYNNPILVIVPLATAITTYFLNYKFLRNRVFLDASLKRKEKKADTYDLNWTKKFGTIAPFLQLDLKLIWRNKRTKTQVFISLAMVFYGLIFYTMDDFGPTSPMMLFVGIFITGIFLSNFGQFIPAWDSAYYSMMMSQNIPLKKYLESKWGLIAVSVVVMFLLSIPYIYFGWEALAINFSCALYNLGVNIPMILFFGSFNKKRIDLGKSAFGNMQGAGATQFLVMLPILLFPILLYMGLKFLFSFQIALLVIGGIGILGVAFRKMLLTVITKAYRKKKYGMIAGFKETNS